MDDHEKLIVASFFLGARTMGMLKGLAEPDEKTLCGLLDFLVDVESGSRTTVPSNGMELLIEGVSDDEVHKAFDEGRTTQQNLARLILRCAGHPGMQ